MVEKVIANLDSSNMSGPDCIPVVVLKNCEAELSNIPAELFNMCLKESCFPDGLKVSLVAPVFKNVSESSTAKNYCSVSLLSIVSKVFEKLMNNMIVDHLDKCDLFPDFQCGFRSSRSAAELLTVVSRAFNRSEVTLDVECDISKTFNRVWHAGLLHKLKSYGLSGQICGLISSFLSNRWFGWFWRGSFQKSIQLMLEFLMAPFLVLHFSYHTLMTFLMMLSVILQSAYDITHYSKCDQAFDLWQQLELASELESNL